MPDQNLNSSETGVIEVALEVYEMMLFEKAGLLVRGIEMARFIIDLHRRGNHVPERVLGIAREFEENRAIESIHNDVEENRRKWSGEKDA